MHASRRRKKRANYGVRSVEIVRGRHGFGFTISGQQPCILSCIVSGSPAERAGLRPGDYLVSANGQAVGRIPHDEVVRLIGSARGTLHLQIAESYFSDSSDDEAVAAAATAAAAAATAAAAAAASGSRQKPKGKPRTSPAQNRAAKVIRDLHTGAMFGEEGAVPPPARPRPQAPAPAPVPAPAEGCLLRCLVGYLGTIEMPRDLQPGSRLQVVRSCIRRLGGERGAATPVLLEAAPRWLSLADASGRALARLPGARVAFASRDARAFALVTAGPGPASACHVFALEPAAHDRHSARAAAFQLPCSRAAVAVGEAPACAEFPADALRLVAQFQALARAPSPSPSSPSPSSRSSSNSDSGIGFRDDGACSDRAAPAPAPGLAPFAEQVAYSVANAALYSVANVTAYRTNNETAYSVANVAKAALYSVASTYDLPSVPLPSSVATSYDLPSVPPKCESGPSVATSYDLPSVATSYDLPSVATSYNLPSVATSYNLPSVKTCYIPASMAKFHSANNGLDLPAATSVLLCDREPGVAKCVSPASAATSPESDRLTVRAMLASVSMTPISKPGLVTRSTGSQDSLRPDHVTNRPMGSQESLRSERVIGCSLSHRPMGSQDSLGSSTRQQASSCSWEAGSPWRPRPWASLQELSSIERNAMPPPAEGEAAIRAAGEEAADAVDAEDAGPASWAQSFERLLEDPAGMDTFAEFLKLEFSHENIAFYASCESFRRLAGAGPRRAAANEIFARHLAPTAAEPVNVDSAARSLPPGRLRAAPPDLFHSAQKQIFNLMKFDSYPRFLKSALYQQRVAAAAAVAAAAEASNNAASAKVKKSRSDAEERRRRSLLPWQRRGRSQSRDSSAPTAARDAGTWDLALRSAHSRQSLSGDGSHFTDKECSGLCRVTLPDGATTVLRPRSGEPLRELVHRLLDRRGIPCTVFSAFLDDEALPARPDIDCASLRGRRLRIDTSTAGCSLGRGSAGRSLEEITNRVFEELLRGKDSATPPRPASSLKSEDWGSEHSSGLLGRFLRRDSAYDKHRESRNKKKAVKQEAVTSATSPTSPVDPLLSPDLFEGLKRAQRCRLEDQRGTEINFELPDFLKDKENAGRAKPPPLESDIDAAPVYLLLREAGSGAGPLSPPPPPLPPKPRVAPRGPAGWPRPSGHAPTPAASHSADARAMPPPPAPGPAPPATAPAAAPQKAWRGRQRAIYFDQPTSSFV